MSVAVNNRPLQDGGEILGKYKPELWSVPKAGNLFYADTSGVGVGDNSWVRGLSGASIRSGMLTTLSRSLSA
jgi:hypothetical protein